MLRITELQTRILEALCEYRYLTASKFERLGISTSRPVIWRELRKLRRMTLGRRPLVDVIAFPAHMRLEGVERVAYLTVAGADVLADLRGVDPSALGFLPVTCAYHRDYWHRKSCIDFQIWLKQALEASGWDLEIACFDRYFDKTGANRTKDANRPRLQARTRVELASGACLIPDANFVLASAQEPNRRVLYSFEMTNGRDTRRVLQKLRDHAAVMQDGALSEKCGFDQSYQALLVFEEDGLLEAVTDRFAEAGVQEYRDLFWFALLKDAERDVLNCWRRPTALSPLYNLVTRRRREAG